MGEYGIIDLDFIIPMQPETISELKRYLISNYHVIFKSWESYYRIVKVGLLNWQKAIVEKSSKQPEIIVNPVLIPP